MATIPDDERQRYLEVLADWKIRNIVFWGKDARRKLEEHLPGQTEDSVGEILYRHALAGGKISKVEENRHWKEFWDFHYDIIVNIDGQDIYVETRFDERIRDWPKIHIVHLHPPGRHSKQKSP